MCGGRLFQVRGPAMANDWQMTVELYQAKCATEWRGLRPGISAT